MRYLRGSLAVLLLFSTAIFALVTLFYFQDWDAKRDDYKTINNAYRDSWPGQPEYEKLKKERGYKQGLATRANTQIESVALMYGGVTLLLSLSFAAVTTAEILRGQYQRKNRVDEFEAWQIQREKEMREGEKSWLQ